MISFRSSSALLAFAWLTASPFAANFITVGGGLSSNYTSGAPFVEASNHLGYHVGAGFEAELHPRLAYATELNLEARGEHGTFTGGNSQIKSELELLYLHVPVFMIVKFPAGRATVDVFAGPTFGIPLTGQVEYEGGNLNGQRRDITDDLSMPDVGLEFGFGAQLPVGKGRLFARPSYYLGFIDMDKNSSLLGAMRSFKLKIGYGFPLPSRAPATP